jgi:curved DNA-binding protein CbpA
VRQAYIERALRFHPDRQEGQDLAGLAEAERRMQAVNGAWSVLGDRDARATYDADLGIVREDGELDDGPPVAAERVTLGDMARRFLPLWILLALLAAIFLFTAYAGGPPRS